jgi:ankyrin repeat protein
MSTGNIETILQSADAELGDFYSDDDEFEKSGQRQPTEPTEARSHNEGRQGIGRVLKRATEIVANQEKREADKYFESISVTSPTFATSAGETEKNNDMHSTNEYDDDNDVDDGTDDDENDDYVRANGPLDETNELKNPVSRLIFYCSQEDISGIHFLLKQNKGGEKLVRHAKDRHGWTAFHWAASRGNADLVNVLADAISSAQKRAKLLNEQDDIGTGYTPLHLAAIGSHLKCIKVLLGMGADKKMKNKLGEIPLDCVPSTSGKTLDSLIELLSIGNSKQQVSSEQFEGKSAAYLSSRSPHSPRNERHK